MGLGPIGDEAAKDRKREEFLPKKSKNAILRGTESRILKRSIYLQENFKYQMRMPGNMDTRGDARDATAGSVDWAGSRIMMLVAKGSVN